MVEKSTSRRSLDGSGKAAAPGPRARGSGGCFRFAPGCGGSTSNLPAGKVTGKRRRVSRYVEGARSDAEVALSRLRVADNEKRLPTGGSTRSPLAASFFGVELVVPLEEVIVYIDGHKDRFGVEPICRVLSEHGCKIAPSTYYARKTRPLSARAIKNAVWQPILLALWTANYRVYGARKLWKAALRDGHPDRPRPDLASDADLADQGCHQDAQGARRQRTAFTGSGETRPRDFTADRPHRLWLTDN